MEEPEGNGGGIDANGNKSFTLDGAPGAGTGGNPGTGTIGGQISTIFGNERCSGGKWELEAAQP